MPRQALDSCNRQARLGQVAAKGVTELVAGDPQSGLTAVFGQAVLNAGDGQALAKLIEKDGLVLTHWTNLQPSLERSQRLSGEVHHPLFTSFAVKPQTRQAARSGFQVQILQRKVADFTHPHPTAQHKQKHGAVARSRDHSEKPFQYDILHVAGQGQSLADVMAAWQDGVSRRLIRFDGEEVEEGV